MPHLNLKDSETHALAGQLAKRRNISAAKAVKSALKEALDRDEAELKRKLEAIRAIAAEINAEWTDPRSSKEIMDSLYDEWGAPI